MNSDAGIGELGLEEIARGDSFQADDPTMDLVFLRKLSSQVIRILLWLILNMNLVSKKSKKEVLL